MNLETYSPKNLLWSNTLFLALTPIEALGSLVYYLTTQDFNWSIFAAAVVFYFATGFGITAGYHRHFAHRAYQTNKFVKLFYALFGAAAFQNSILKWASDHRRHHHKVDTPDDPYNIRQGFFYAHMGWVLLKEQQSSESYIRDLAKDPIVIWQDKYYVPIAVTVGIVIPTLIGGALGSFLGGFALIAMMRLVLVHHFTFFINSLCHMWGSKPYNKDQTARDNGFISIFTFGEGYHNFHHQFQADYRNGLRWYHFDPTKWLIFSLSQVGMAWDLRRMTKVKIVETKLSTMLENLKHKMDFCHSDETLQRLEQLKKSISEYHMNIMDAKQQLNELRKRKVQSTSDEFQEMKRQIREMRARLNEATRTWYQTYKITISQNYA